MLLQTRFSLDIGADCIEFLISDATGFLHMVICCSAISFVFLLYKTTSLDFVNNNRGHVRCTTQRENLI